jgi:sRNA-binding regulator protein Hfq
MLACAVREGCSLGFELFDGQKFEAKPIAFGTYSVELQDKDGARFCVYKHAIKIIRRLGA